MSHTVYFSSCFAPVSVLRKYQQVILNILNGNLSSGIRFKKLVGSNDVYSARVSQSARLLFTVRQVRGKNVLVFLESYDTHDDYDKSVFIRSRGVAAKQAAEFIEGKDESVEITHENFQKLMGEKGVTFEGNNNSNVDWVNLTYYNQQFIQLTDDQQGVLMQPCPVVVLGTAGSGKTVLSQEIIRNHANNDIKFLYLATSEHLVSQEKRTYLEGNTNESSNVEFTSLKALLTDLMLQGGITADAKMEEAEQAKEVGCDSCLEWIRQHVRDNKQRYLNLSPLLSNNEQIKQIKQIKQIYQQFRIISGYDRISYADVGKKHTEFNKEQRSELMSLYSAYLYYLRNNNQFDVNFIDGEQLISEPAYDMVVVDEAQDFSLGMLKFIFQKLVKNKQAVFLLDPQQRLHGTESRCHYLTSHLGINKLELKQSLRCPEKIMEFANEMLVLGSVIESIRKKKVEAKLGYSVVGKEGGVYWLADDESNHQQQFENLRQLAQTPMFAIVTSREYIVEAKQKFSTELVFTAEEIKGLEYFTILLYKPISNAAFKDVNKILSNQDKSKRLSSDNDIEEAIKAFFVACTRAMDMLWIIEKRTNQNSSLYDKLQQTAMKLASTEVKQSKKPSLLAKATSEKWMDEVQKLIVNSNDEQAYNIYSQKKLGSKHHFDELLAQLRPNSELEPSKQCNNKPNFKSLSDCSSKQSETKSQRKRKSEKGKKVAVKTGGNAQPGSFIPSQSNIGNTSNGVSKKLGSGSRGKLLSLSSNKTSATVDGNINHHLDTLTDISVEDVFLDAEKTEIFLQQFSKKTTKQVLFQNWLCVEGNVKGKSHIEEIIENNEMLFNLTLFLTVLAKQKVYLIKRDVLLQKFKFSTGDEGSLLSIMINKFIAYKADEEMKAVFVNFLSRYEFLTIGDILEASTAVSLNWFLGDKFGCSLLCEKLKNGHKKNYHLGCNEMNKFALALKNLSIENRGVSRSFCVIFFSKLKVSNLYKNLEEYLPNGVKCNLKNILHNAPVKFNWLLFLPFGRTMPVLKFIEDSDVLTLDEAHGILSICLECSPTGFNDIHKAFNKKFGAKFYSHVCLVGEDCDGLSQPLFLSVPISTYLMSASKPNVHIGGFVDNLCDDLKGLTYIKALFRTYTFEVKIDGREFIFSNCSFFSLSLTKKPLLVNELHSSLKKGNAFFCLGDDINCLTRVPKIDNKQLTAPIIHLTLDEKSRDILQKFIDDNKENLHKLCVDSFYQVSIDFDEKSCFGLSAFSGLCKTAQGRSILKQLYMQHPDLVNGLTEKALIQKVGKNLAPIEYLSNALSKDSTKQNSYSDDENVCHWIIEHIIEKNKKIGVVFEKLIPGESKYLKQSSGPVSVNGKNTTDASLSVSQDRFFNNGTSTSASSSSLVSKDNKVLPKNF